MMNRQMLLLFALKMILYSRLNSLSPLSLSVCSARTLHLHRSLLSLSSSMSIEMNETTNHQPWPSINSFICVSNCIRLHHSEMVHFTSVLKLFIVFKPSNSQAKVLDNFLFSLCQPDKLAGSERLSGSENHRPFSTRHN